MADGSYHPDDDAIAQGERAIRAALLRKIDQILEGKTQARMAFDRREQAARFILDGLDGADWLDVAPEIARRLTEQERVGLLVCVIKSLPDDMTAQVLQGLFEPGLPVSDRDHKHAAAMWSGHATPAEIKAFVHAGIKQMPKRTRDALRDWLSSGGKA